MTSLWRHSRLTYYDLGPNFLTQGVKLLPGEVWQVSKRYFQYFRSYFRKTTGGGPLGPPPAGRGLIVFVCNPSTLAHICQSIRYNLVSVLLLSGFVKVPCLSHGVKATLCPKSNPIHTIFTNCAPFPLHFHSISISIWISTPLKGSTVQTGCGGKGWGERGGGYCAVLLASTPRPACFAWPSAAGPAAAAAAAVAPWVSQCVFVSWSGEVAEQQRNRGLHNYIQASSYRLLATW